MITSKSNEIIKQIRKLREKKYRLETGLAFIEGKKLVIDAINAQAAIEKIIITESLLKSGKITDIINRLNSSHIENVCVSDELFDSFSQKDNPKGIAAIIRQHFDSDIPQPLKGLWVGLYEIADPGNLGTIIRTVDGAGGKGVILIGNCTDPYDPGALRASMGAIFNVRVIKTTLESFVLSVEKSQIPVYGTSDNAKSTYYDQIYVDNLVLLMGSERQGLPEVLVDVCEQIISLPMLGTADSLNLAVATGVFLYDILGKLRMRSQIQ